MAVWPGGIHRSSFSSWPLFQGQRPRHTSLIDPNFKGINNQCQNFYRPPGDSRSVARGSPRALNLSVGEGEGRSQTQEYQRGHPVQENLSPGEGVEPKG